MPSLTVVEHLPVFKQAGSCLIPRFVIAMHRQFRLECIEETFRRRIIPVVTLATHVLTDRMPTQQRTIVRRRIRGRLVGVQYRRPGSTPLYRHVERTLSELRVETLAHSQFTGLSEAFKLRESVVTRNRRIAVGIMRARRISLATVLQLHASPCADSSA